MKRQPYCKALQKMQTLKRKASTCLIHLTPTRSLRKNRRAVSAVISNMILIAAVIVVGFTVLAYVRSTSSDYQTEYQQTVSSDVEKLKETLAYEYIHYDAPSKELRVYFMNAGTIDVQIDKIYLSTATESFSFEMYDLNGQPKTNNQVAIGEEREIIIKNIDLVSGTYIVKLTTIRGLTFADNYVY
jgi:hypothetical protein